MTNRLKVAVFFITLAFFLIFTACKDKNIEVDNEITDTYEQKDDQLSNEVSDTAFSDDTEKDDNAVFPDKENEDFGEMMDNQDDNEADNLSDDLSDEILIEADEENDSDTVPVEIPDSEMVEITGGSFMMGCQNGDILCYSNGEEEPLHQVTISTFMMDKYEVKTADFKKCIAAGACTNENEDEPHYIVAEPEGYYTNNCTIDSPDWDEDELAVNCVSWFGADTYCKWVGKRLPTEAEWEYAASGSADALYTWGNESPTCDHTMMYDTDSSKSGCGTESVGKPGQYLNDVSPFGIYDMAGNLTEWVNDRYKVDYYSESPMQDPQGPETGNYRVFRGGFWGGSDPAIFRNSARLYLLPASSLSMHGFRCAK